MSEKRQPQTFSRDLRSATSDRQQTRPIAAPETLRALTVRTRHGERLGEMPCKLAAVSKGLMAEDNRQQTTDNIILKIFSVVSILNKR